MAERIGLNRKELWGLLLVILISGVVFWPLTRENTLSDSPIYLETAQILVEEHQLTRMPHFLYPLFVAIVKMVLGVGYGTAGWITTYGFDLMLSVLLFIFIRSAIGFPNSNKATLFSAVLAISLMLVAPILLLAPFDHHFYFGYIGINVYHNATIWMLKPFALFLTWLAVRMFMTEKQLPLSQVIGAALLCVITTLAKPNFTMNLLPALGIYTLYRMWMKQYIDWRMLLVGFLLPCSLVLGWQFVFTYQLGANMASDQKVIFAPFSVYRLYSDWLFPKFILSILFPLGIFLLYHREACRKVSIQLAWLIFLVGAFYSYFMAEQGKNFGAGNFTWNAQIGLFILFVFTTLFFIQRVYPNQRVSGEEPDKKSRTKAWLGWTLYGLHLISGLVWAFTQTGWMGPIFQWWSLNL